jgi:hypothetical protein
VISARISGGLLGRARNVSPATATPPAATMPVASHIHRWRADLVIAISLPTAS